MAQAVKFTFDSLLREDHAPRPVAKVRMVPEAELEQARAEAFEQGRAAGRAEAEAGAERALALVLQDMTSGTARLLRDLDGAAQAAKAEAAGLALAMARKLSGRLIARMPLMEIEGLLAASLAEHHEEPRLVVRLDETLVDPLRRRLDALMAQTNYAGRVILIGEPDYSGADCRIEWPDGGIERRTAAIEAALEALVARFGALSRDAEAEAVAEPMSSGS